MDTSIDISSIPLSQIAPKHVKGSKGGKNTTNKKATGKPKKSGGRASSANAVAGNAKNTPATASGSNSNSGQGVPSVLNPGGAAAKKLQDLVKDIDPAFVLHPEVEEVLLQLADDFIDNVTDFACRLAKHRNSPVLEGKDLQLCLEKYYGISVPGVPGVSAGDRSKLQVKSNKNSLHLKRIALKRKYEAQASRESKVPKTGGMTIE